MRIAPRLPLALLVCLLAAAALADEPATEPAQRPPFRVTARMKGHTRLVRCLAFHPGGTMFVTGGSDRSLRFWDVAERMEKRKHVLPPSG